MGSDIPDAADTGRRRRVLVVGPVPPPMGGIVRYAQDLLTGDLTRSHSMTLFRDNIPFELRPRSRTVGFTWNVLARDGVRSTTRSLVFVGQRLIALDRALSGRKFDILHVLSTAGLGFLRNAVHIQIARRHGVRTVFHLLGQIDDFYRDSGPITRRIIRAGLDGADVHVTQSPMLAQFVAGITRRPVRSIVNGIRIDELAPPDGWSNSGQSRPRIISVGILGIRKGTFDLIEVAALLK